MAKETAAKYFRTLSKSEKDYILGMYENTPKSDLIKFLMKYEPSTWMRREIRDLRREERE